MKKQWISFIAVLALSGFAAAQVAAGSSSSAGASVAPGQANANVNSSQNAQAGGTTANANSSGSAQVSRHDETKQEHGAKSGAGSESSSSAATGAGSATLGSTSNLQAELTKPIDAGKAKPGDEVTAKLTQDFKSDGKVVFHKGSKLVGHVTEAQAHSKNNAESRLGIVFDKVQPKGGEEASINAMVQALAPPVHGTLASSADESLNAPAMGGSHGGGGGGGGLLTGVGGGATSTLGSTVGTTSNVASGVTGGVTSNVSSTVSGAAGTGLSAQGTLTNASRGAIGMQGLSLSSVSSANAQGSIISSASRTVKLESGTQMLLQLSGAVSKP